MTRACAACGPLLQPHDLEKSTPDTRGVTMRAAARVEAMRARLCDRAAAPQDEPATRVATEVSATPGRPQGRVGKVGGAVQNEPSGAGAAAPQSSVLDRQPRCRGCGQAPPPSIACNPQRCVLCWECSCAHVECLVRGGADDQGEAAQAQGQDAQAQRGCHVLA
eukprot:scaffold6513_cov125-Isochrysis_galbana.AAC.6